MHAWINERLTSWLVPSPAEIVVTFDTTTVTDGQATPIDFGKAFQGQKGPVKMFTVQNVGGQTLVLGSVSVPLGYTLVKVPPSSLGPGQQDSFAVALETATQGTKAGQISFVNNDSDESPFNFPITGLVLPPPPTLVFVDSGSNCPSPDGSQACPFTTFCEGYDAVAICGTVKIQAGSYAVCRSQLTKCALFESLGGSVTLHPLTPSGQSAAGEAAVKLSGLRRQSDGSFALRFNGVAGQRYQVFSSTDLVTWELRSDFTSEEENFEIIDTNAAGTPKRFFKFVVQ